MLCGLDPGQELIKESTDRSAIDASHLHLLWLYNFVMGLPQFLLPTRHLG